jgi:hypothetical protein
LFQWGRIKNITDKTFTITPSLYFPTRGIIINNNSINTPNPRGFNFGGWTVYSSETLADVKWCALCV